MNKKTYTTPVLTVYGNVSELTQKKDKGGKGFSGGAFSWSS